MQQDKGSTLNLWLPAGYKAKINQLLKELKKQGVELKDNRGNPSTSALFRYLIDAELNRGGRDNE